MSTIPGRERSGVRSRQLECFVRVCELGSITKAAHTLNIAQPALGIQIKVLEREFGVQLLERTIVGTRPTPAGLVFLEEAKFILRRLQDMKRTLREIADSVPCVLTLGITPSLTASLAGRLLERLATARPRVTLNLVEELSHKLVEHIESGALNMALAFNAPLSRALDREPLLREVLYFVTTPGSRFDLPGPIQLRDLVEADLTMPSKGDLLRHLLEEVMNNCGLSLHIAFPIDSMQAMKSIIAKGIACGVLPYSVVAEEIVAGTLSARPIGEPPLSRTLFMVRDARGSPSDSIGPVIGVIRDVIRELCAENANYELV